MAEKNLPEILFRHAWETFLVLVFMLIMMVMGIVFDRLVVVMFCHCDQAQGQTVPKPTPSPTPIKNPGKPPAAKNDKAERAARLYKRN
jgi:hypothetical protein